MIEIMLDPETTGLSVKDGHRIVEIGCLELDDLVTTGKKFHCYLNPERKVSESAFKVHGYSDEFLSNQKKFKEIAKDFLNFIRDKKIVIHNAEFDLSHLNNELYLSKSEKISNKIIDTLILARNKHPGSQVSLDALCNRYRIDNSTRTKHNALLDCELLAKVYINLTDQKEPMLNFDENHNEIIEKNTSTINYFKKVVVPSAEEEKKHQEYLKENLKKNFFS